MTLDHKRTHVKLPFWVTTTDAIITNGYHDANIYRQSDGTNIQRSQITNTWRNNQSTGASESITMIIPRPNEETVKLNKDYEFKKQHLKNPADLCASIEPKPNMHHVSLLKMCNKPNKKGKAKGATRNGEAMGKEREGEKEKLRKLIPEGFLKTKLERKFRITSFKVSRKPKGRS